MKQPASRPLRLGAYLHLLVLGGLAVAQPVLDVTAKHAQLFVARGVQPVDLVIAVSMLLVGPGLVLGVVVGLCDKFGPAVKSAAHTGALALLVALISLPVLKTMGTAAFALALLVAAMFVWAYRRTAFVTTFLTYLSPALVVIPLAFFAHGAIRDVVTPPRPMGGPPPVVAPNAPPVVVMVLDELPLVALMDERREIDPIRYPRLAELAQTATWFRNATTVYSRTRVALPALVTGRYPQANDSRLANATAHPENLFSWLGEAIDMGVVEGGTQLCPDRLNRRLVAGSQSWTERNLALWRDLGWVYLHIVTPPTWGHRLPNIDAGWKDFGVRADASGTARSRWFHEYLAELGPRQDFGLHFLHVLLPHSPYEYYPSGRRYNDRWTIPGWRHPSLGAEHWAEDADLITNNYQRLLLQTGYADRLVGELIDRLRSVGIFEKALVVVVADHGISFRPGSAKRGVPGEDPRGEIMPIPLLVKAPGQARGQIDDSNVELIDVAPTVADALGLSVPWPVDGQSLLDPNAVRRPTKRCGVRALDHEGGGMAVFGNWGEGLDRALAWQLETFGSGRTRPRGLFRFGRNRSLVGQRLDQLRVVTSLSRVMWSRSERYGVVDPAADEVPTHIHGWLGSERPARDWVIAINGVVAATTVAYQAADGRWGLSAVVPEDALQAGANRLDALWVDRRADGTVVLHHAQARTPDEHGRGAFAASSEVVFQLDRSAASLVAGPNTVLDLAHQDGVGLRAFSGDPYISFDLPDCCDGIRQLVAMIEIEIPAATELALFFQTQDVLRFGFEQARRRNLTAGRHRLHIVIDHDRLNGRLRLDPGQISGTYLIRALEIRAGRSSVAGESSNQAGC